MKVLVETVHVDESAESAWGRMKSRRIRHLVVTRGADVAGVVSDRDLGGARGQTIRKGKTIADFMTPHVIATHPEATIRQAANLMRGRTIGCLPVVEEGRLVGIITVSDLLDLIARGTECATLPAEAGDVAAPPPPPIPQVVRPKGNS